VSFSPGTPERGCLDATPRYLSRPLRYRSPFYAHFANACQNHDETGLRTFTSVDILCYGHNCQNVAKVDIDNTDVVFRHEYPRLASNISTRIRGAELGEDASMLPFLFWRVSIWRQRSPPSGAAEVSRGEPRQAGVIPSPVSHPGCCPERRRDAAVWRLFSAPLSCLP
jgi:hypothetical protein